MAVEHSDVGEQLVVLDKVKSLGNNPVGLDGAMHLVREYVGRACSEEHPCPWDVGLRASGVSRLSPARIDALGLDAVMALKPAGIQALSFASLDFLKQIKGLPSDQITFLLNIPIAQVASLMERNFEYLEIFMGLPVLVRNRFLCLPAGTMRSIARSGVDDQCLQRLMRLPGDQIVKIMDLRLVPRYIKQIVFLELSQIETLLAVDSAKARSIAMMERDEMVSAVEELLKNISSGHSSLESFSMMPECRGLVEMEKHPHRVVIDGAAPWLSLAQMDALLGWSQELMSGFEASMLPNMTVAVMSAVSFLSLEQMNAIGPNNLVRGTRREADFMTATKILAIAKFLSPEQIHAVGIESLGSPFMHAGIVKYLSRFPVEELRDPDVIGAALLSPASFDFELGRSLARKQLGHLETPDYLRI